MVTFDEGWQLPVTLLGLLFIACGAAAWWVRPDRWTLVFLLHCAGQGVHWGGSIDLAGAALERAFLLLYLAFTVMGEAAFLHLALIYPSGRKLGGRWLFALYAPAGLTLLTAAAAPFVPAAVLQTLVTGPLLIAHLASLAAGLIFIVSFFTVDVATRRAARFPLIVIAVVFAGIVSLLGEAAILPGSPSAWNMASGILPIFFAIALVSNTLKPSEVDNAA